MKAFRLGAFVAIVSSLTTIPAASGSVQDKPQSVVGVVVQTDASRNALAIRTDTGEVVSVHTGANTSVLRFPAWVSSRLEQVQRRVTAASA